MSSLRARSRGARGMMWTCTCGIVCPAAAPSAPAAAAEGGEDGDGEGCRPAVFCGLLDGELFWVEVEEDPVERAASDARQAAFAARSAPVDAAGKEGIVREKVEGCSCIWGNPCEVPDGCQDWNGRYALAKKNGWRG